MKPKTSTIKVFGISTITITLLMGLAWTAQSVWAKNDTVPAYQASPIHPTFPLLDNSGENVLESGGPVSTMQTCGACHNTDFIEQHSYHADVGLEEFTDPGETITGRPWDTSPGLFGKWNPLNYRYLSPDTDELLDLGTPEWIMTIGVRHVGGGPSVYSRDGNLLTELLVTPGDPQTHILDHETGDIITWDWIESGVVEMNCFLCHIPNPDNESRIDRLHAGDFKWANTATLNNSGIVETNENGLHWNPDAFDQNNELKSEYINIQDPTNENCGLCHGLVHDNVEDPLVMAGCSPERWKTITTGQIISPQRLSASGMNLADKETLSRSWDIHAERLLNCTDCHYSLNNPLYYQETSSMRPGHLMFDPRRVEIGEYLSQPLHQFARGSSAQSTIAPELKDTMRRCESCHAAEESHKWLPYTERHMQAVDCETCHIPKLYSSSNQTHDWTVIKLDGSASLECRGVVGDQETIRGLLTGYEPIWLPNQDVDGMTSLTPYNLLTSFFWVYNDPPRPVRLDDLKSAYLENGDYHPGVLLRFDKNGNGKLEDIELMIDTPEKERFIANRLSLIGLENPRIVGEIQPYNINHNVTNEEWAISDCQTCHSKESRVNQPIQLASFQPGGVTPVFVNTPNTRINGKIYSDESGALFYRPESRKEDLYILGQDHIKWVDVTGGLIFLGVIGGIIIHGGIRTYNALRQPKNKPDTRLKRIYMYGIYERLWHWLQTFVIGILIITGLVIHRPDTFGFLSFRGVVLVHNIMAAILGINAFLALFYHLASGEIKQFIPRPYGFFDQAITQAMYYLRGIFKAEAHPFEKTPAKKLNPLQQLTYLAILNLLLPLQGITGILIWGAQRWPKFSQKLGGLTFLSPFHTLTAWLFAAFVIMHVYLTTTGHQPLTAIKAMMMGWEEIESHLPSETGMDPDFKSSNNSEMEETE
jgi:thiosulfate reductase cytochrome b subunit